MVFYFYIFSMRESGRGGGGAAGVGGVRAAGSQIEVMAVEERGAVPGSAAAGRGARVCPRERPKRFALLRLERAWLCRPPEAARLRLTSPPAARCSSKHPKIRFDAGAGRLLGTLPALLNFFAPLSLMSIAVGRVILEFCFEPPKNTQHARAEYKGCGRLGSGATLVFAANPFWIPPSTASNT